MERGLTVRLRVRAWWQGKQKRLQLPTLLALTLLSTPLTAHAEQVTPQPILTANAFLAAGSGVASDPAQLAYLLGTVDTLMAMARAGATRSFCPEPDEALPLPRLLDLVDRAVAARPALADRPLAEALLAGFERQYKC